MNDMMKRDEDLEYKVLRMIKERGDDGMLQSDLWKMFGATSREGSRISLRLGRTGLIKRHRELHDGKWTYRLMARKRMVSIDSLMDLPCTFCPTQDKCDVGGILSPNHCTCLTTWIEGHLAAGLEGKGGANADGKPVAPREET